ncbi:MAG: SHOCT domain-containing protein [Acidimicrobiales bacterium]
MIIALAVCCIVAVTSHQHPHRGPWVGGAHAHPHPHEPGHFAHEPGPQTSEAMKILRERFARGEIDAAEFTQRRDLLKGTPPQTSGESRGEAS